MTARHSGALTAVTPSPQQMSAIRRERETPTSVRRRRVVALHSGPLQSLWGKQRAGRDSQIHPRSQWQPDTRRVYRRGPPRDLAPLVSAGNPIDFKPMLNGVHEMVGGREVYQK